MVPPHTQGLTKGLSVLSSSSPKHILQISGVVGRLVCSRCLFSICLSGIPLGLISMVAEEVLGNLLVDSKFRVLSLSFLKVGSQPSV